MERIPVFSSNVASVGYDEDSETLEIEFKNGAVYQYSCVPIDEYKAFISADSKGTYFHQHIKHYPTTKL